MISFKNGINLGGWLSQYRKYDRTHFQTFIIEKDIDRIAKWGFDHIRLPFDYSVLEDDTEPFSYKEEGFNYLDRAVDWARKYNLGLILDLHAAPGFSFTHPEKTLLFEDGQCQERFISLWETIVRRYRAEGDFLAFELLNEIVLPDSRPWNRLANRMIASLREIDIQRWLIVGGNNYNAVTTLKEIDLVNDSKVIYNFHFYEPHLFTHQKAPWMPLLVKFNQELTYPGDFSGLSDFLKTKVEQAPWDNVKLQSYLKDKLDINLLRKELEPAVDFVNQKGKTLYCGEYGVIDRAPLKSRINWTKDVALLLGELGIGRAYWSYKAMDFGLVNYDGQVIDEELVKAAVYYYSI